MKNFVKAGDRYTYTNATGTDIASGAVVVIGSLLGIACVDIANGEAGEVSIERGVFSVPKTAGSAFTDGCALTFDISAGAFVLGTATAGAGDISGAAVAYGPAASAATTANVLINAGLGTVEAG